MISKTVKAKLMERLRKKSTSKYPVNIFKERLFTDQSVRYCIRWFPPAGL